ncbi:MAG TPA: VOC family protein [Candidatus Limnocylindria bacterium]|jgi:catechol 2,3-dioxygenase|nr:VOC family protein [Candidatus Limnocylindria bacterium]
MSLIDHPHKTRPAVAPLTGLRLGAVELTVRDVTRSVAWYQRALGLQLHSRGESSAVLGDGRETLVILDEDPQARPAGHGTAGLYHYALLYPTREDLARAAVRLAATQTRIDGASDHGFHEAIYLPDPDGNGIELAADRAPELWPAHGDAAAARPRPLDFSSLLDSVAGEPPPSVVAPGVRMGHVHLYVGDVSQAVAFYRDVLGFDLQSDYGVAAFLSVDGYHHHVAVNTWNGVGATAPPAHTAGLRQWTATLPTDEDVEELCDRLCAAKAEVRRFDGGLTTVDPFGTAVTFVAEETS